MLSQAKIYPTATRKLSNSRQGVRQNRATSVHRQPSFSRIDKSPRFFLLAMTFLGTLFLSCSIFYINTHVRAVELGYDITQSLVKKQKLIEGNKQLASQVAQLKSPQRLQEAATLRLGMSHPEERQILRLSQLKQWTQSNVKVASVENEISSQEETISKPLKNIQPIHTASLSQTVRPAKPKAIEATTQVRPKNIVLAQARTRSKSMAQGSSFKQVPTALLDSMP